MSKHPILNLKLCAENYFSPRFPYGNHAPPLSSFSFLYTFCLYAFMPMCPVPYCFFLCRVLCLVAFSCASLPYALCLIALCLFLCLVLRSLVLCVLCLVFLLHCLVPYCLFLSLVPCAFFFCLVFCALLPCCLVAFS